ncbi:hypothetical protein BGX27_006960 [Mortierella sp. AM989]|nr:hypothetical protein BGX27_006960 [Mortierella sp. AM989]
MTNKPSAKAIAKLNATTLFPEIRKEIIANPSLFAIRGFFIFNVTKKNRPMTEWYLLFQGFDAPAIVSQKKPEIPKAKRDEDPIPVAILQIEDSDLLNFMSGGLTGPRGIVSGKIKIAGAVELAEQLEQIFKKAKGPEKTLAYLDNKRTEKEAARARLFCPSELSSSPTSTSHKPIPATQSKVHDLARRYSAMAKQPNGTLGVPIDVGAKSGSFGWSEGAQVSGLLNRYNVRTTTTTIATGTTPIEQFDTTNKMTSSDESKEQKISEETVRKHFDENKEDMDVEKEIETNLQVSMSSRMQEFDLVDIPLSNSNTNVDLSKVEEEEEEEEEEGETVEQS